MNKPCISAFPIEGEGRLLRSGSISRLIIPFTFVPACTFSVYASQWVLPPAHARLDTWLLARRCHDGHLRPLKLLRFKAQPRTDPGGRDSRTALPPRVFDGKADAGPRMKDSRKGQVGHRQPRDSIPRRPVLLAATPKRAPPK